MRATTRAWAFLVVSPVVLFFVLWAVRRGAPFGTEPDLYWDDDLRREVQTVVGDRYVDPVGEADARRLFESALGAYVGQLDPFSRFVPAAERDEVDRETQGQFGGVGVRVASSGGGLLVTAVRAGGPAHRAGIRAGDLLERADGESFAGRDLEHVLVRLRGEPGTTVVLDVRRDDAPLRVEVVRAVVPLDTVPAVRVLPGSPSVGYLRIEQFSETTTADVREALTTFRGEGVGALVVDLRQNLGGVVKAAVEVAGFLLPPGTTVCVSRMRHGGDVRVTHADPALAPLDLPLAVLVDESSASASEILAGALQDHGRGVLVGRRTWGKFLVQTLVATRSGGALVRLTTARYETPRGRSAPRDAEGSAAGGLEPDVIAGPRADAERNALLIAFQRQSGPHWITASGPQTEPRDAALDTALALLRGGVAPAEPVRTRTTE